MDITNMTDMCNSAAGVRQRQKLLRQMKKLLVNLAAVLCICKSGSFLFVYLELSHWRPGVFYTEAALALAIIEPRNACAKTRY